jgi:phage terminase large subunit-like protein
MKRTISPVEFIDRFIKLDEKGQPWKLSPYQRRVLELAFRRGLNGALLYRQVVLSEPKKSGKTFLAACLALWWAVITESTEIIISANDREQAQSRVFQTMCDLIEKNASLASDAKVYSDTITMNNGTVITAISSDFKGAAGSRHSLVVYDELWGFESESSRRLYDELTPPPTEFSAWVLIVTYAGFNGESDLLESIYKRGLQGRRIDSELECYEADDLFMFWSNTARQPWQTGLEGEAYYASQRKILRPAQFQRLHRNEWVSSENAFIDPEVYDACVEPGKPDLSGDLFIGIDCATKRDCSAVVVVKYTDDSDRLLLADCKVWRPTAGQQLDIGNTIEFYLRRVYSEPRARIERIYYDPFQMIRTAQMLVAAGFPCEPFDQTLGHLTSATENLLSLFTAKGLRLYPHADLRAHCLNAITVESAKGIRLAKEKQSAKIDAWAALSFACLAAVQAGRPPSESDLQNYKPPEVEVMSHDQIRFGVK